MRRKKKRNKQSQVNDSWLLPYSDLLTLIAALFIVLFAMSEIDAQKYEALSNVFQSEFKGGPDITESGHLIDGDGDGNTDTDEGDGDTEKTDTPDTVESNGEIELSELQALLEKVNHYIDNNELADVLDTKLTDEGLLITILNDISFDSGSAEVSDKGSDIAKEMSTLLDTDPPREVVVSGHTDDNPIHNAEFSSNWELSTMRAINFMTLILNNSDLDPTKFSSRGYGEHRPIASNSNEENRMKNRRVEVLILPNWEIQTDEEKD